MTKVKLGMLVLALLGFLALGWSMPQVSHAASQTNCPVLGNKIDKKVYVDYQGKRIYFCCAMCKAQFKQNPEKYLEKMKAEGVTPAKTP